MKKNKYNIIIVVVVLLVVAGGNYFYTISQKLNYEDELATISEDEYNTFSEAATYANVDDQEFRDRIASIKQEYINTYLTSSRMVKLFIFYLIPIVIAIILFNWKLALATLIITLILFFALNTDILSGELPPFSESALILVVSFIMGGIIFIMNRKLKDILREIESTQRDFQNLQSRYSQVAETMEQLSEQVKLADKKVFRLSNFVTSFYNLAKDLGAELRSNIVLKNVIGAVVKMLDADSCELFTYDAETKVLLPKVSWGWEDETKLMSVKIKLGEGIIGWVAKEKKLFSLAEAKKELKYGLGHHPVVKTEIAIPLLYRNELIGVINISKLKKEVPREDLRFLYILSSIAAMSINNAILFEKIQELADVDSLTKLKVNRYFQEHLNQELKRARRYNEVFSIIMTDIDHFKNFNDTYGHQIGDFVLAETAKILRNNIRQGIDLAARYGGEEFICLLPKTDQAGAVQFAERLRKSVEASIYHDEKTGQDLRVTLSLGVSTFPINGEEAETLIREADIALYQAKESGRNRVCVARTNALK